jgi:pyruvate formate lyase activating enzyme
MFIGFIGVTMIKPAMLYEKTGENNVHCFLCSHHCRIAPSKYGVCGVRQNLNGELFTFAYGRTVAANVDPIEKKPLFHVLPGSRSYSMATVGCNFQCGFCQNWQISQAREASQFEIGVRNMDPEEIVRQAKVHGCKSISYTYTEPTIFFEYAYDTARIAEEAGLYNIFVTNGFMTAEALAAIQPYLDAANVDLKSFNDETYRTVCKGRLQPVLDTIRGMHDANIWVEVTTLVVPQQNDSPEELRQIASFVAGVGKEIPWHVSMFHPDYHVTDRGPTPIEKLKEAYMIGKAAGLRYVYMGNVDEEENTYCHVCNELLIRRFMYRILEDRLIHDCRCPRCHTILDGKLHLGHPSYIGK